MTCDGAKQCMSLRAIQNQSTKRDGEDVHLLIVERSSERVDVYRQDFRRRGERMVEERSKKRNPPLRS